MPLPCCSVTFIVNILSLIEIWLVNLYMRNKNTDYSVNSDGGFFTKLKGIFKRRITLMLIPHSEKKVLNIQVSLFSIIAVLTLFFGLLFSFFILSSGYTGSLRVVKDRDTRIDRIEADLYETSKAVEELNESAEQFKQAINSTLLTINSGSSLDNISSGKGGDLNNLLDIQESDATVSDDIIAINKVRDLLDRSVPQLIEISDQIEKKSDHFIDMPSIFPLKGGKGRITLRFGAKKDPFTGKWYIHRGLDIGHSKGIPIIATANGEVTEVKYQERGYGHYVSISHKWHHNTWYAHMQKTIVVKGQHVKQGQVIGYMGSSGRSTGPHLHYEVRVGPTYVNPEKYIGNSYK